MRSFRNPRLLLLFFFPLLLGFVAAAGPAPGGTVSATGTDSLTQPQEPGVQRLAYTMTFLGIPVARAILDEVRPPEPGGDWIVRGGARTTAFWEQFTHIHNAYLTSFRRPGGEPTVYERCIDEKGLRFDSVESYGEAAADPVAAGALPTLPERYSAGEEAGTIETTSTPAGRHNFFSALWYLRYEDWERIRQTVLPLTVEGEPWRLTLRREAREPQAVPGGRVETWRIVCTLEREDGVPAAPPAGGGEDGRRSDYVTRHLITEEAVLTFWIACESARRPVAVKVELPKYTVRGKLREPYEDERLAGNAQR